jgi:hypothetical protein
MAASAVKGFASLQHIAFTANLRDISTDNILSSSSHKLLIVNQLTLFFIISQLKNLSRMDIELFQRGLESNHRAIF